MFEAFKTPEIVPDEEQAKVWETVRKYFESVSDDFENGRIEDVEKQQRIDTVLGAIEQDDFIPAAEYLATEIKRIQKRIPLYEQNRIGREISAPAMKQEIEDLQKLLESLSLEEE